MLISRRTSRLNDKNISAAGIFFDLEIKFAIGKSAGACLSHIATQMLANFLCQILMRVSAKNFDVSRYAHFDFGFRISDFGLEKTKLKLKTKNLENKKTSKKNLLVRLKNMAGAEGLEPANAGSKTRCLTTWRRPSIKIFRN